MLSTTHTLPLGTSSVLQFALPSVVALTDTELDEIWALKPVERGIVKLFGRTITVPRTQWSLGQDYAFSGVVHKAQAPITVHPALERLRAFVEQHSGIQGWSQMLVNFYENGGEYIGPHSDDQKQLKDRAPIYSFSFGAERKFVVHASTGGKAVLTLPMIDNTCIVMQGDMQHYYKHSVPKTKQVKQRRLNVTLRLWA